MGNESDLKEDEHKYKETLLSCDTVLSKEKPSLPKHLKILYTVTVYASFMGFSLCRSMYGPNLVELRLITGSSLDEISTVFTWLGAGGIMGSLIYGFLFDHFQPLILFVVSLLGLGIITIFIPWCTWLPVMMTLCGLQSFIFMGISVGCNVMIFRLWKEKASPVLLGMHVLYTVGGFLAPMLSRPFMVDTLPHQNRTVDIFNITHHHVPLATANDTWRSSSKAQGSIGDVTNNSYYDNASDLYRSSDLVNKRQTSSIYYAYLIVGIYLVIITVFNIIMFTQVTKYKRCSQPAQTQKTLFPQLQRKNSYKKYISWGLFILFNICFGGLETIYSGFLFTFASNHVYMGNSASSLLVAMLFVSYSIGRFAAIFTTHCIPTHFILLFDLTCGILSGTTLSYFTDSSIPALWGCTIVQGIGSSTIWVTALLWAKDFLTITGRFTSTYVIAYTVGMMTWPALTGFLLETGGSQWFPYMSCLLSLGCMLWFVCLWVIQCICPNAEDKESGNKEQELIASLQSLHAI